MCFRNPSLYFVIFMFQRRLIVSSSLRIFSVAVLSWLVLLATPQDPAAAQMAVGTNLDNSRDFSATLFNDAFKQLREWRTRDAVDGAPFDSDFVDQIPVDENGWPSQVPFSPNNGPAQIVHSLFPIRGAGTWTLTVEGTGQIQIRGSDGALNSTTFNFNGGVQQRQVVIAEPEEGYRADGFLDILVSDPSDPLRNMSFTPPQSQASGNSTVFQETYFERMGDFSMLRFMDLAQTNNNLTVTWEERVTPSNFSQGTNDGVALEHLVALANTRQRSGWFCVPARANDQYVRDMAVLIRDSLDPDLKCFIEYSNETWNSIFNQSAWVQDQGEILGLSSNRFQAGQRYHSLRSAQIWEIFEEEFGDASASRLVKVMASQSSNVSLSETRMEALQDADINPSGIFPDVLAIAPYFGNDIGDDLVAQGAVDSTTVDQILDLAEDDLETVLMEVQQHNDVAAQHDIWLVNYEGGQHLVGNFGNQNNDQLTDKLIAANRTARMGTLYEDYLNIVNQHGVQLHCNFTLAREHNRFGSWGILEDQDQAISDAPKFAATTNWIANNPPANVVPRPRFEEVVSVDSDGDQSEEIQLDGRASRDLDGEIVEWEWFIDGSAVGTGSLLQLELGVGQHEVTLQVTDNQGAVAQTSQTLTISPQASALVLVESDFTGPDPSATIPWLATNQLGPNTSFSGWELGDGLDPDSVENAFGFSGRFDPDEHLFEDSILDDNFLSYTVSPDLGYVLDLRGATLSLGVERIDFHASRRLHVLTSIGGFTSGAEIYTSERVDIRSLKEFQIVLPFEGFRTIEPVEFRIYMSGGRFAGHSTSLNSFELRGASSVFIRGDVDLDGDVTFLDISRFVSLLNAGDYQVEADTNDDGFVNFLDIGSFIALLTGS